MEKDPNRQKPKTQLILELDISQAMVVALREEANRTKGQQHLTEQWLAGQVVRVLGFFMRAIPTPDEKLLGVLAGVGTQVGVLLERQAAVQYQRK